VLSVRVGAMASGQRLSAKQEAHHELVINDIGKRDRRNKRDRRWSVEQNVQQPADDQTGTAGTDEDGLTLLDSTAKVVLVNDSALVDTDSDPVLRILRRSADSRSEDDLEALRQATSNVKFFRQMNDPTLHLELCRHITLEQIDLHKPIFEQGDEGTTFYIIYSGAVKVCVLDQRGGTHSGSGRDGSCVCVLEDGDSFGELALLGNGLRAATVIAEMPTQLLRVEKVAYDNSLHRLHEQELHERMCFLQRIFLFSDWKDEDLARLAKVVTSKAYPKNACIIQQRTNTDHMYLIVSGRCRVLKRMDLSRSLHSKLESQRGHGAGLNFDESSSSPPGSPRGSSRAPTPRAGTPREGGSFTSTPRAGGSPRAGGASSWRTPTVDSGEAPMLELGELSVHQYFGERALLDGKHKRHEATHTASVVSITPVEVMLLSKYDFYHCIDAKTQSLMVMYAEKFYFDEERIRRSIHKQFRWDAYKQGLLKDVRSPRASPRGGPAVRGGGGGDI